MKRKINGFWDITPRIIDIRFPVRGKIQVAFQDGRVVTMPISAFPAIKKLSIKERKKWYLIGGGFTWDNCSEVIHPEQILGNYARHNHDVI